MSSSSNTTISSSSEEEQDSSFDGEEELELVTSHIMNRRQGNTKIQSERHLRPTLSSMMTRWDSQRELVNDRPPLRKQSSRRSQTTNQHQQPNPNPPRSKAPTNKHAMMVKMLSESHLDSSSTRRWKASPAVGVDRAPRLKRENSVGSSALFNASFPLRSRSGSIDRPLGVGGEAPPQQSQQQHQTAVLPPPPPPPPPCQTSTPPSRPAAAKSISKIFRKGKEDTATLPSKSPISVMEFLEPDYSQKQDLVTFLERSNSDAGLPLAPMRSESSCLPSSMSHPGALAPVRRQASSQSCMTKMELGEVLTSAIRLLDQVDLNTNE